MPIITKSRFLLKYESWGVFLLLIGNIIYERQRMKNTCIFWAIASDKRHYNRNCYAIVFLISMLEHSCWSFLPSISFLKGQQILFFLFGAYIRFWHSVMYTVKTWSLLFLIKLYYHEKSYKHKSQVNLQRPPMHIVIRYWV